MTIVGPASHQNTLLAAFLDQGYDPKSVDALKANGMEAYIESLSSADGQLITDRGTERNDYGRLEFTKRLADAALEASMISQSKYDSVVLELAALEANLNSGLRITGKVTKVAIELHHEIAQTTGVGSPNSTSAQMQLAGTKILSDTDPIVNAFVGNDSGAFTAAQADQLFKSLSSIGSAMDTVADLLPAHLSSVGSHINAQMVGSFDSLMVGLGGGFVGDTAEFLNLAYDAIKTGAQTGDWTDFQAAVANYGIAAALSAAVITTTTVVAAVALGPVAAAAVAGAWAAYGLYDAIINGAELVEKVQADIAANPDWVFDVMALFGNVQIDPLVLDLNGDGIELSSLFRSQTQFDLDGDGFAERTAWVEPDDGLLVYDANGNGTIDDISELFGSPTATGYSELAAFDTNSDGVVDAQDAQFSDLEIWQDLDGDGQADAGELTSLSAAGIASIGVTGTASDLSVNFNRIIETGSYTRTDGSTGLTGEVLFRLSQAESTYTLPTGFQYDTDMFERPYMKGFGEIPDFWVAATQDATLKTDADAVIASARAGNFAAFATGFDALLADWAGVGSATWYLDTQDPSVLYAYDPTELAAFVAAHDAGGNPPFPDVRGYVFVPGTGSVAALTDAEIDAWETEMGLVVPGQDPNIGMPPYPVGDIVRDASFSVNGRSIEINGLQTSGTPATAPTMTATKFAVLQKLMGQDYRDAGNYLAPSDLLVFDPSATEIADLEAAYEDMREYYSGRFLAQSAWSIMAQEGASANLGALAPFENIYLNPITDSVVGAQSLFANELIESFRTNAYGTDAEALALLSTFQADFPYLGTLIAAEFTDIGRAVIGQHFDIPTFMEGTTAAETLNTTGNQTGLGHEGADTINNDGGDSVLIGGAGDDQLNGGSGNDTYIYRNGDGADTINDFDNEFFLGTDHLILADATLADTTLSRNGTDLILSFASGGSVTIKSMLEENLKWAIDQTHFADGTVLDEASMRAKLFEDMKATGAVVGTELNDNYSHRMGDGSYTVRDFDTFDSKDRFVFEDVTVADVVASRSGEDLVLTLPNSEAITFKYVLNGDYRNEIEFYEFADGTVLSEINMRAKLVEDMKATGVVVGTENDETYHHALGDGSYSITDRNVLNGNDRLVFADQTASDIATARVGDDLVMTLSNGEVITLVKQLESNREHGIEHFNFSDGSYFSEENMRNKTMSDMKSTGQVTGTDRDETYYHVAADGSYRITDHDIFNGDDRLVFSDLDLADVTAHRAGTDLKLHLSTGETITVFKQFESNRAHGLEHFDFADGAYLSWAGMRNKMLEDSKSLGWVTGTDQDERYYHSLGDGSYSISDYDIFFGDDRLYFTDVDKEDVTASRNGYDLILTLPNGESITIRGQLDEPRYSGIESFFFADGSNLSHNGIRNKMVADMKPTGFVLGTEFDETYYHYASDGSYTIRDRDVFRGQDRLYLQDAASSDVSVMRWGDDLVFGFISGETVRVQEHFDFWRDFQIEHFHFADGVYYSASSISSLLAYSGTSGSDTISGNGAANGLWGHGGNDTLYGNDGDDLVYGGSGNDLLYGGAGDDRIYGSSGLDTLWGDAGADEFVIEDPTHSEDVVQDFVSGEDTLSLVASGFGLVGTGSIVGTSLWQSGAGLPNDFGSAGASVLYFDTATSRVWFDTDGGDGSNADSIAVLSTGVLAETDVFLI